MKLAGRPFREGLHRAEARQKSDDRIKSEREKNRRESRKSKTKAERYPPTRDEYEGAKESWSKTRKRENSEPNEKRRRGTERPHQREISRNSSGQFSEERIVSSPERVEVNTGSGLEVNKPDFAKSRPR